MANTNKMFRIYWTYKHQSELLNDLHVSTDYLDRNAHFDIMTYPARVSALARSIWGWELDKGEMAKALQSAVQGKLGWCTVKNKKWNIAIRVVK